jgi:hypothetical protein
MSRESSISNQTVPVPEAFRESNPENQSTIVPSNPTVSLTPLGVGDQEQDARVLPLRVASAMRGRRASVSGLNPHLNNAAGIKWLNSRAGEITDEETLAKAICDLWGTERVRISMMKYHRQDLSVVRNVLAKQLHRYKSLLVRTGCDGKWAAFLRENEIPRATADRYVKKWEDSLATLPGKRLTEAFPAPTSEEITRMVDKLKPKLARLTTPDSVDQFLSVLATALQDVKSV